MQNMWGAGVKTLDEKLEFKMSQYSRMCLKTKGRMKKNREGEKLRLVKI